ncbi:dethiobiotin synthase [Brevundimonas sp. LM2]|uniref:dethiobiotin synthase n=1 Tax=Brevundimonas sp. LM2 TaxID=1938605 RepID=UPI000983A06E|nr:dethiobiotin synthase [Brevundimonas sp. LM2]AQR61234.1 dethiobiotin synthase [Brevundimonas sp. LM2]
MSRFVVTGTNTDIGKTVLAAALTQALDGCYWKPVQAGLEDGTDAQRVAALTGLPDDRILPEAWRLRTPASPHHAADLEGVRIDADALILPACDRPLVIEGAGGALVPLNDEVLFADVFARWGLPVVVCASTALGTINHSLMTLEVLRGRGAPVLGVAFIGAANDSSEEAIVRFGRVKRLGRLPWLESLTPETLRTGFASGFDVGDFA